MQFWSATKDHNNYVPSTDLVKAITQCLNYIYAIECEANSVKFIEKTKSKVIKPRCILIFGRSNDWNDEQRGSLQNTQCCIQSNINSYMIIFYFVLKMYWE